METGKMGKNEVKTVTNQTGSKDNQESWTGITAVQIWCGYTSSPDTLQDKMQG